MHTGRVGQRLGRRRHQRRARQLGLADGVRVAVAIFVNSYTSYCYITVLPLPQHALCPLTQVGSGSLESLTGRLLPQVLGTIASHPKGATLVAVTHCCMDALLLHAAHPCCTLISASARRCALCHHTTPPSPSLPSPSLPSRSLPELKLSMRDKDGISIKPDQDEIARTHAKQFRTFVGMLFAHHTTLQNLQAPSPSCPCLSQPYYNCNSHTTAVSGH